MTSNEMTIAEASARYGIKPRTLWKQVAAGRVVGRLSGRIWLITKEAMVRAIIGGRVRVDKATVDRMVRRYLNAVE